VRIPSKIGSSFHDTLLVPYPTDRGEIQSLPGVVIQAQMVSQLLAAAIEGRPLIHSLPLWVDLLWVWGVAVTGGFLVVAVRHRAYLLLAGTGAIVIVAGTCILLLQAGYWVPFVPAAIAIVGTGSMLKFYQNFR
jgi:CHASE2 domain-containing sensor protein